ncbi:MAG: glycosyltransferase, partial [Acidimicrobiia bacterium]
MNAPEPLVSVCIVSGRRGLLLRACLESLQAQQDAPPFELLVCADADSGVGAMVKEYFPEAEIVHVPKTLPGAARNELLPRARGEVLFFLDDDIVAPPFLLRRLVELMKQHPEVGVFGGPNVTPPGSSRFQVVQGAVLASPMGAGPVRRRYGDHPFGQADERSFILCNLAVRREAMVPFDTDLVCAEENAVLLELKRRNLGMLYDPYLAVYHERRDTPRGFAQQMFKYGRGRGQVMARRRDGVRP